jgi:hypothetical protein
MSDHKKSVEGRLRKNASGFRVSVQRFAFKKYSCKFSLYILNVAGKKSCTHGRLF